MSHSLMLPPSGADIWVPCAGSPLMATHCPPQQDTDATREGEASHWAVATVLKSYTNDGHTNTPLTLIGTVAPNGIILTEDMIECAEVMIHDVLEVCQEFGLLSKLHIEEKMRIPGIHKQCFGTPDVWAWDVSRGYLWVWDYKYGHKSVPPDSWQNKCYVKGAIDVIDSIDDITGHTDQTTNVVMRVVQPRSYHDGGPVKEWHGIISDLRGDFNLLHSQAQKVVSPNPDLVPGLHCRYCPARHQCPASRETAASDVEYSYAAIPEVLTDEGLSFEKTIVDAAIERLKHRKEALDTDMLNRISYHKGVIPGYDTKQGTGNRSFNAPNAEIFVLGDLLGVDMHGPEKTITVAEFERRVKAKNRQRKIDGKELIDPTVINGYITKANTSIKLVPSDQSDAKRIFSK